MHLLVDDTIIPVKVDNSFMIIDPEVSGEKWEITIAVMVTPPGHEVDETTIYESDIKEDCDKILKVIAHAIETELLIIDLTTENIKRCFDACVEADNDLWFTVV